MSASLFCKPQRFYSVRCHIYQVVSTAYEHQRFISVYRRIYFRLMSTVYEHKRFISVYCQYVFLSGAGATTDVGVLPVESSLS